MSSPENAGSGIADGAPFLGGAAGVLATNLTRPERQHTAAGGERGLVPAADQRKSDDTEDVRSA